MLPLSSGYAVEPVALRWPFSDFGARRRAGSMDQRCLIAPAFACPVPRNFLSPAHVSRSVWMLCQSGRSWERN